MIARTHRFHGLGSLRFAYAGQAVRSGALVVRYRLNQRRQTFRCAVVVSKKVHKSAVVRNRIRRRIYGVVQQLEPNITSPYDIVVSVHDERLATQPADDVLQALKSLFTQAGMLS